MLRRSLVFSTTSTSATLALQQSSKNRNEYAIPLESSGQIDLGDQERRDDEDSTRPPGSALMKEKQKVFEGGTTRTADRRSSSSSSSSTTTKSDPTSAQADLRTGEAQTGKGTAASKASSVVTTSKSSKTSKNKRKERRQEAVDAGKKSIPKKKMMHDEVLVDPDASTSLDDTISADDAEEGLAATARRSVEQVKKDDIANIAQQEGRTKNHHQVEDTIIPLQGDEGDQVHHPEAGLLDSNSGTSGKLQAATQLKHTVRSRVASTMHESLAKAGSEAWSATWHYTVKFDRPNADHAGGVLFVAGLLRDEDFLRELQEQLGADTTLATEQPAIIEAEAIEAEEACELSIKLAAAEAAEAAQKDPLPLEAQILVIVLCLFQMVLTVHVLITSDLPPLEPEPVYEPEKEEVKVEVKAPGPAIDLSKVPGKKAEGEAEAPEAPVIQGSGAAFSGAGSSAVGGSSAFGGGSSAMGGGSSAFGGGSSAMGGGSAAFGGGSSAMGKGSAAFGGG
ncbi:unnamed protein product, partial [Amoebophrya sp. A120]|eukprot:GSA120T00012350001.1